MRGVNKRYLKSITLKKTELRTQKRGRRIVRRIPARGHANSGKQTQENKET